MTPSDQTELRREQFLELGRCIGPYDSPHRCSALHCDHCGLCDISEEVLQLIAAAEQRARIDELNRPKSFHVDIEMPVDFKDGFDDAVEQMTQSDQRRIAELEQSLRKEQA